MQSYTKSHWRLPGLVILLLLSVILTHSIRSAPLADEDHLYPLLSKCIHFSMSILCASVLLAGKPTIPRRPMVIVYSASIVLCILLNRIVVQWRMVFPISSELIFFFGWFFPILIFPYEVKRNSYLLYLLAFASYLFSMGIEYVPQQFGLLLRIVPLIRPVLWGMLVCICKSRHCPLGAPLRWFGWILILLGLAYNIIAFVKPSHGTFNYIATLSRRYPVTLLLVNGLLGYFITYFTTSWLMRHSGNGGARG